MKKIVAFISVLLTTLLIVGCGKKTTTKVTTTKKATTITPTTTKRTTTKRTTTEKIISKDEADSFLEKARYTIYYQGYEHVLGREYNAYGDTKKDKGLTYLEYNEERTRENINNKSDCLIGFDVLWNLSDDLMDEIDGRLNIWHSWMNFDSTILLNDIRDKAERMILDCTFDLSSYIMSEELARCDIEGLSEETANRIYSIFKYKEIVIPKRSANDYTFSLLEYCEKEGLFNTSLEKTDYNIVATGIAALFMQTPMKFFEKTQAPIEERYYFFEDMSAQIDKDNNIDLKIYNPLTSDYIVKIASFKKDFIGDGYSLTFSLSGCRFADTYKRVKMSQEADWFRIVYDDRASDFTYDPDDPMMGVDPNFQGGSGCYYCIYVEGVDGYIYTYERQITKKDGSVLIETIFPDGDFYPARNEQRMWTKKGYPD